MNLKQQHSKNILENLSRLVREERRITTEILWHLREVEERKLFVGEGYTSLFSYCVDALKYSESAAYRRILAMRALRQIPELGAALENGLLSVATVCLVQKHFSDQAKAQKLEQPIEQKKELLNAMIGKSKLECQKMLAALSPQALPQEKERAVSATHTEISFIADDRLMAKLKKIKDLTAHKNPNPTYAELIEMMADLTLNKIDPTVVRVKKATLQKIDTRAKQTVAPAQVTTVTATAIVIVNRTKAEARSRSTSSSRYIPTSLKHAVWLRDRSQCTYIYNGRRCKETRRLEIDHIRPFALDGQTVLNNVRLLCRAHNQYRAIKTFGLRRKVTVADTVLKNGIRNSQFFGESFIAADYLLLAARQ